MSCTCHSALSHAQCTFHVRWLHRCSPAVKNTFLTHSSVLTFKLCYRAIVIVNLGMFVIAADPAFAVSVETSESSSRCVGRGGGRPSGILPPWFQQLPVTPSISHPSAACSSVLLHSNNRMSRWGIELVERSDQTTFWCNVWVSYVIHLKCFFQLLKTVVTKYKDCFIL